jgi:3-methyl-2-oxobutanoate hydroxymethyltransferase
VEARRLIADAKALRDAGAFSVVLESIPAELAKTVTGEAGIPTIGIGAGPDCDGQVLVSYDALGLSGDFVPPFAKQYVRLGELAVEAAGTYAREVREGRFPARPPGKTKRP